MAITGSGTQADPWIVHDYTELKTVCESGSPNVHYVELANDINGNDYGADFKWNTITIGNRYYADWTTHLDLKGHTIKNIQVAENGYMFYNDNGAVGSTIKNGKILNVFLNGANALSLNASYENVSMSINGTGAKGSIFNGVQVIGSPTITSCAIYIELTKQTNITFITHIISNTDIKLKISDLNNKSIFSGGAVSDSRITGECEGGQRANPAISASATNCVVNVDFTGSTDAGGGMYAQNYITSGSGVINTDIIPSGYYQIALTPVTSQEIINGDALRAKGFVVVNVSA